MKKLISAIIVLAMLFTLASCGGKSSGGNIVYPIETSPDTLDPQYAKESGAQLIINNIFEGLVRYNAEGEIIPGIAESWTVSDDGLTYTFYLKKDTEWYCSSNIKTEFGDEFYEKFSTAVVTANDFVFACRRAVDPATDSPFAHRMMVIQNASEIVAGSGDTSQLGVTAINETTLEFKLVEPCTDFLSRLTESEFMPCNEEFFNSMSGRYGLTAKHILCNGPFYVSSWDYENTMTCKANKFYGGEQTVVPSSVIFAFENTEEEVLIKLASGSITAALLSPETELPKNVYVSKEIKNSVYGFAFNCEDVTLSNANIRRALCSSADVTLFDLTGDNIYPESGFIPEVCTAGSVNYREKVEGQTPTIEHNEESAVKMWNKGLKALETESVALTVICPEFLETSVRKQFQIWQDLFGVSLGIKVQTGSAAEINEAVESGDYQIAVTGIQSEYTDAVSFLSNLKDDNIFNFTSEKFQNIIDRLSLTETEEEIISGCFTAEDYLLKQGVFYPLYTKPSRFVISDDASDISILNSEKTISFIIAGRSD